MNDNERLVRSFYSDVWERRDASLVPRLISENFVFRGSLGFEQRGHAEFLTYVDFVHAALGDYRCQVHELISEGERTFARMIFKGTHRGVLLNFQPTGLEVSWAGAALFRFEAGKVASLWVLGDIHGLLQQLTSHELHQSPHA